jgi:phosphoenolpyruvate phosphomutase
MTRTRADATGSKGRWLRAELASSRLLKVAGVHDGFTALLADRHEFDALWVSGLGICASHGVPDASILTLTEFLHAARLVDRATRLPTIADCDTGFGDVNNLVHLVREYERAGIAAVCIEDKVYPKRNSFSGGQQLLPACEFAAKLDAAKQVQSGDDFMVLARIESLIVGAGEDDALARAALYLRAGADGIVLHSKSRTPDEVLSCARRLRQAHSHAPILLIPTTYPTVSRSTLREVGVSAVIYANQMLRAFVTAADTTLATILKAESSASVEEQIAPVSRVLAMIGTDEVTARDRGFGEVVEGFRQDRTGLELPAPDDHGAKARNRRVDQNRPR